MTEDPGRKDDVGARGPPLLEPSGLLDVVDGVLADATDAHVGRLWMKVSAFPAASLLTVSVGAATGEEIMEDVTRRMQAEFPMALGIARLGGDEVAVASLGPVRSLSRRFSSVLAPRFQATTLRLHDGPLFTSIRTGICFHQPGDKAEDVLRKARLACWAARRDGDADVRVYDETLEREVERDTRILRELVPALERDELALHYQPVIDLGTGTVVGLEALLRWPRVDGRMMMPDEFIPLAESSGLIVPLGEWALRRAVRQAAAWRADGMEPVRVAINVSPMQFYKTDMAASVRSYLDGLGIESDWLALEVTESVAMKDSEPVLSIMKGLRDLGVCLSLDDFGKEYSSLSELLRLPIDQVKIDRSFLNRRHGDAGEPFIVEAIVAMAMALRLGTVAEGVETEGQARWLAKLGCQKGQGFFFSQAVPPEAVPALREDYCWAGAQTT